jgi:hypothetical protein
MIYRNKDGSSFKNNLFGLPIFGFMNKRIKLECMISKECWDEDAITDYNSKNRLFKIKSINGSSIEILFTPEPDIIDVFNLFVNYNDNLKKYTYICSMKADSKFSVYIKKNKSGIYLSVLKPKRVFSRKINSIIKIGFYYILGPKYKNEYEINNESIIKLKKV